jgi:hypothetical protein
VNNLPQKYTRSTQDFLQPRSICVLLLRRRIRSGRNTGMDTPFPLHEPGEIVRIGYQSFRTILFSKEIQLEYAAAETTLFIIETKIPTAT